MIVGVADPIANFLLSCVCVFAGIFFGLVIFMLYTAVDIHRGESIYIDRLKRDLGGEICAGRGYHQVRMRKTLLGKPISIRCNICDHYEVVPR